MERQAGKQNGQALTRPPQVLVEGPAEKLEAVVPRHSAPLSHLSLTRIVIEKLPRAAGTAALTKVWKAQEVESKWNNSAFALNKAKTARRHNLNDFERFKAMRLRKQVSSQMIGTLGSGMAALLSLGLLA
jgi:large subunit ribosomal protein L14e